MKTRGIVLTCEELEVLALGALQPSGKHLSNYEIGQRLGISVSRVKTLIHQACAKLGANNRNQVILFALRQGELSLGELFSVDELAEIYSSLSPDTLRKIAHLVRQGMEHEHLSVKYKKFIRPHKRQNGLLTNRERDVLILASYGLTNQEMAEKLCMSTNTIRSFLYRAFTKLGARTKADAVLLALKKREMSMQEIFSVDGMFALLAPLGAEAIEKMAQLLDKMLMEEIISTDR